MKKPINKREICMLVIAIIGMAWGFYQYNISAIKSDVRFRDKVAVNDSLFFQMFDTQRGVNANTNKRIDNISDTVRTVNCQVLILMREVKSQLEKQSLFNQALMREVKGMQKYDFLLKSCDTKNLNAIETSTTNIN